MMEEVQVAKVVDARGSFCPGPLMALLGAVRQQNVGDVIALYSSDTGSRTEIPLWVQKAKHELIAVRQHEGYDEFLVRKMR